MSRSAHAKSTYRLRKLPKCSRCNGEFVLVCASYEGTSDFRYEWECQKCHKVVPKDSLREENSNPAEAWLHDWCKENELQRREEKKYEERSRIAKVSH